MSGKLRAFWRATLSRAESSRHDFVSVERRREQDGDEQQGSVDVESKFEMTLIIYILLLPIDESLSPVA